MVCVQMCCSGAQLDCSVGRVMWIVMFTAPSLDALESKRQFWSCPRAPTAFSISGMCHAEVLLLEASFYSWGEGNAEPPNLDSLFFVVPWVPKWWKPVACRSGRSMDQNSNFKNNWFRSQLCITTWPPMSVEGYMDSSVLWSKKCWWIASQPCTEYISARFCNLAYLCLCYERLD